MLPKSLKCFKTSFALIATASTFAFAPASRAATIAPPLSVQVTQAAQDFTGLFDNAEQVASNPSVPLVAISSCGVQLAGGNADETQNVYFDQESVGFQRVRVYSFSPDNSAVKLSIRSFVNNDLLSGICNKPESERIVNISNIIPASCDLDLFWEPSRYTGNNAPNGCPTSTGGKVVSRVSVWDSGIDSLDQIFTANGVLITNTLIAFRRINSIPEPSSTLALVALGTWGIGLALKGKLKQKSTQKEKV